MYRACIVVGNFGNIEERSFASAPLLISLATHLERIIFKSQLISYWQGVVLDVAGMHDTKRNEAPFSLTQQVITLGPGTV